MVLDFLPYKLSTKPRKRIGWIRYIIFAASLIFVAVLFLAKVGNMERIMFWAFVIGNTVYYAVGIALAYVYKDNRAFCKYICPITRLTRRSKMRSAIAIAEYSTPVIATVEPSRTAI
ncbi:hypothetical protein GCWU000342_00415 [Shuttleworthella satelles DSM 14600]|uniref:4Fe-4S ferredoxin-type domain-containing protein n=1 Tax=Shuttleworthella satelles DSM 14600 TaxID=626523 RepID=C4G8W7_9FIRM|nr:hypothetical protein GCWU000342_00415 [Shuttleworthia satelles DSM 14600]